MRRVNANRKILIFGISLFLIVLTGCTVQKKDGRISDAELSLRVMRWEHPSQPINKDALVLKEIFLRTNIRAEIEAVSQANYESKKRILLSTNNLPDIMQINRQDLNDYAKLGLFLPLYDKIKQYAPHFYEIMQQEPEMRKLFIDNELYGFPVMRRYGGLNGLGPVIRKDLLKKHDLKIPDSFDELYETLKKLKKLYPETYPWTIREGTKNLLKAVAYPMGSGYGTPSQMGISYGLYYDKDVDGGKYTFGPITPEFKHVLDYLHKLYRDGILDPDYNINSTQQWLEKLTSGKSLFFYDNSGLLMGYMDILKKSEPEAEFGVIPIMKNSKGVRRNFFYTYHWWDDQYVISSKVKEPVTVVKFMDWLYSSEGSDLTSFGILDQHYTWKDGKFKTKPHLIEKHKEDFHLFYAIQSELGTGYLSFCPYVDETQLFDILPQHSEFYEFVKNDPGMVKPLLEPPLTTEEINRVKELREKLDSILMKEADKFIMGVKPIEEYDNVMQRLKEQGALEVERIYNKAMARFLESSSN